jgi:uncharacterized membrane protein YebE (DUF533 family)
MDALRLLGSLARGTLGRSMPGGAKAAIGLGLVGVAIAAVEHYQQQQTAARPPSAPLPPPVPGGALPPPVPPPPPLSEDAHEQAILLVQAMIAASGADGVIDDEERGRIRGRLEASGAGPEERAFLEGELDSPPSLDDLVAKVGSPQLAEEVYLASLLAIRFDSNAERVYMRELASRLALDAATVTRLHQLAGVQVP